MRTLLAIGIGAGNPDFLTVQAVKALNRADVVFVFDKGERAQDLIQLRKAICEQVIDGRPYRFVSIEDPVRDPEPHGYTRGVETWHRERARVLAAQIEAALDENGCGAFLVCGDPSFYDSTLRLLDLLRTEGNLAFNSEVIPGISAIQALAASHQIVLNTIGGSVSITTGRDLAQNGFPAAAETVVVMLDRGDGLKAAALMDADIHWGAYLGTPDEILVAGKTRDVIGKIEEIRTREKQRHGWIMDTYILRRST